jgi:nicotinamide-nucleotide amidase
VSTRAGIVVTGTEVLTGRVADRNGPWLAEQLRLVGVDIAEVIVVGDRPADLLAALTHLADRPVDLIITSGGLGPTADDLTARVVGDFHQRPSALDPELERRIAAIVERLQRGRGWRLDPEATAAGVRKQALVPAGATVLEPVGTAPGLVVPPPDDVRRPDGSAGPPVVVLPGPPRELQNMWPAAVAAPPVAAVIEQARELRQNTLRLWGTMESDLAAMMREQGAALDDLEITTCLREGELEIVTRYGPDRQADYDRFAAAVADRFPDTLFSADGATIDEIVAGLLRAQSLTIATAESCTAGLLAGRLTELAGSSDYVLGGLVVYSNQAKHDLAGVPTELIERVGAVSEEVAVALADGARDRLGADIGVGITGIAGPGGGSAEKPVGLVHFCVSDGTHRRPARWVIPGGRSEVRGRAVLLALQLVRRLLQERR